MPVLAEVGVVSQFLFRIVPAFDSLRRYTWMDARGDTVAGLTVAAVAVPQAMAYAMVAGVPPEYGLYTAIVMTAVGAVFDSSRQLINGPTNAISIAVLSACAAYSGDAKIAAVITLAFMIGVIQLGITAMRLGDLSRYISHSVIVGFTLGAGGLLVLDQIKNLVGLKSMGDVHDHFVVRFWHTMTAGGPIHPETAAIGLGTIALVLTMRWLKRRLGWTLLPELLLSMIAMSAVVAWLGLDARGVKVVGEIPAKLPSFSPPPLDTEVMRDLSSSALAIALLGLLEAVAMAKAIAAHTKQKLDLNQQCLSEAVANTAGSFFQCMPGSGSLTRSSINQQAGGSTQWSGVISAIAVAATMLVFAPYARFIPRAALAGILVVSAVKMVDWHALAYSIRATRFDTAIVAVTAFAAIGISIEFCVLIGVMMSFMLAVRRVGRMLFTEFVVEDGIVHERQPGEAVDERMLIFGFEGEFFFGAAADLERHFEAIESRVTPRTQVVILRVKRVRSPDAVCLHLLEQFVIRMQERGVVVLLGGVRRDLHGALERTGVAERVGLGNLFIEQKTRNSSTMMAIGRAYEIMGLPVPSRGVQAASR